MPDYAFFIWIAIALIQIVLFSIFLFRSNKNVDIFPVVNYNNMTYWKDGNNLYRESANSTTLDKDRAQLVNHLDSGLNPSELMYIIKLLEDE